MNVVKMKEYGDGDDGDEDGFVFEVWLSAPATLMIEELLRVGLCGDGTPAGVIRHLVYTELRKSTAGS